MQCRKEKAKQKQKDSKRKGIERLRKNTKAVVAAFYAEEECVTIKVHNSIGHVKFHMIQRSALRSPFDLKFKKLLSSLCVLSSPPPTQRAKKGYSAE